MTRLLTTLVASFAAVALLTPIEVLAAPTKEGDLDVVARYVFEKAATRRGVNEVLVRIENLSDQPAQGRVTIGASMGDSSGAEATYRLDGRASVFLHLPVQVSDSFSAHVRVEKSGALVANEEVRMGVDPVLHVVDLQEASHLFGLNGTSLGYRSSGRTGGPGTSGFGGGLALDIQVETPFVDPATGDVLLPAFATGWAGIDLAIVTSERLARIEGVELESLSAYVLSGGTLAVVPTRDEDLRSGTLAAFIGGAASRVSPRPEQLRPTPMRDITHPRLRSGIAPQAPGELTTFTSWAGGNLVPTPVGAAAQYGLGRVVLLGFDVNAPNVADDPWVQLRVMELLGARPTRSPATPGRPDREGQSNSRSKHLINPERHGNWGIALSAILLCIYAVIAGPVAFARAKAKNRPLRALVWLPLFSVGMFLAIVVIGVTARGSGSRARRLTFVDVGAGMDRGVGRRFRAVLFPSAATFDAAPERRTSFLQKTSFDRENGGSERNLQVDREGAFLSGVNVAPWETATLREEGIFSVGAGISVSTTASGDVNVRNRTGRTLKAVLVKLPDDTLRFFGEIAPDVSVVASAVGPSERPWRRYSESSNAESDISAALAEGGSADASSLFIGVTDLFGRGEVEWMPSGVPVVLASFEEPSGRSDTGAPVEWDRTFVRVVGVGGEP